MTVQKQIKEYIAAQPEPKLNEMQELHGIILALMPACKSWFLDGKDEKGKIVSNPNIGTDLAGRDRTFHYGLRQGNGIVEVLLSFRDARFAGLMFRTPAQTMFNECIDLIWSDRWNSIKPFGLVAVTQERAELLP